MPGELIPRVSLWQQRIYSRFVVHNHQDVVAKWKSILQLWLAGKCVSQLPSKYFWQLSLDVGLPLHRLIVFLAFVDQFHGGLSFMVGLFLLLSPVRIVRLSPFVHLCVFALALQQSVVDEVSDEEPNAGQNDDGAAAEVHVFVVFGYIHQLP